MRGINHIVLFVADLPRSIAFYEDVLEFERLPEGFPGGAFLRHPGSVGLYHVAWEVDTLSELVAVQDRLTAARALTGASDHGSTKALYARDPDGIEFEVCWLVPDEHVEDALAPGTSLTAPLDIEA